MWQIVSLILLILIVVTLIKVFLSKNIFEKLVALDIANILVISFLVSFSFIFKQSFLIDLALVYALLSFIGVLCFAQYYQNNKPTR
jgi:multicomponent Na+:H+ antiporter subunit F